MKIASDAQHLPLTTWYNVTIPISDVDRSKTDLRNLIGVIIDFTEDNDYKVGTKDGIIAQMFIRNQIASKNNNFFSLNEGQGFVKCSCLQKCTTKNVRVEKKWFVQFEVPQLNELYK
ncbi:uncharacterized protein LOC122498785 [Leptopilina heterotoma]|uniref:uncharacterized protein LOC122498785 n=1 Tax=Leptopilina heterotoma TaxID=63436 RepID=UPI001CA87593|nr:uncharacterized protein LOC122498785 [Leptopilina heterotoma]